MPTRIRKSRKRRGHRQMGYGRVGGHRKHPGGRGKAGGLHHKRTSFDKYHPGYFGKLGMRNYHVRRNIEYNPTINIDKIWSLIPDEQRDGFLQRKSTTEAPVVDVTRFGFFKVLGRGSIPQCPIIIKARYFSSDAEKKLRAAGGVPLLVP